MSKRNRERRRGHKFPKGAKHGSFPPQSGGKSTVVVGGQTFAVLAWQVADDRRRA